MKFACTILTLCALHPIADGFLVQPPKISHGTSALGSSRFGGYDSMDFSGSSGTRTTTTQVNPTNGAGGEMVVPDEPKTRFETRRSNKQRFDDITSVKVQGGSLRTCSFEGTVDRVTVLLRTDGRPLNANVDLWQGPDNAPQKMSVYLEDGLERPFCATIESPGSSNTVAIRNTGQIEFPITAGLECDMTGEAKGPANALKSLNASRVVQGGAVYTLPFSGAVKSVQVLLVSDGRPLNARIELLQGPNNNKQVMEVYTEDGAVRPFFAVIDTPGSGNVVRIVNTATVEFPLSATVEPYIIDEEFDDGSGEPGSMRWS